jgi:hypothetical protein
MAPISVRRVWGEMGARGFLTERSLTPDLESLRNWAIDAVQIPTADLVRPMAEETFDLAIEPGSRRVFALPFLRLKAITLTLGAGSEGSLNVFARVNGDREVLLGTVASRTGSGTVPSPSYRADAIIIEAHPDSPPSRLTGLGVQTLEGTTVQASRLSAYLSQPGFQEIATTPQIRVFRLLGAKPLISGMVPIEHAAGPDPGGRLVFHAPSSQTVDVAVPFLRGWSGDVPVSEFSGRLRVQARAIAATRLRYTPPLFFPGILIALLGLFCGGLLLSRPAIVAGFLKTRRDEGK